MRARICSNWCAGRRTDLVSAGESADLPLIAGSPPSPNPYFRILSCSVVLAMHSASALRARLPWVRRRASAMRARSKASTVSASGRGPSRRRRRRAVRCARCRARSGRRRCAVRARCPASGSRQLLARAAGRARAPGGRGGRRLAAGSARRAAGCPRAVRAAAAGRRGDAQAVVEVGAELALFGEAEQVFLGRGDDAAVDGNRGVRAQPFQRALLQHAQQLDLHGERHALDFVEEQRAAAGVLDLADAPLGGAGVGAGFVAEDFAVEQRFGQPAAVDGDEVALAARAGFVQAAGDQFLAGAGFAVDQHVGGAVGQAGDHLRARAACRARVADQARSIWSRLRQLVRRSRTSSTRRRFSSARRTTLDQMLGRERLLDEVVGAVLHRLHGHRNVAVAGDQHHRQFGVDGLHFAQEGHAVHARQADVADHDAAKIRPSRRALLGAAGAFGGNAFELQRLLATEATSGRLR
jgi:hypothetical protein